jgi:hypothetical protein
MTAASPRVGVACASDPLDPGPYSGIPAGLVEGLTSFGTPVLPIQAALPSAWQRRVQYLLAAAKLRPGEVRRHGLRAAARMNQTRLLASPTLKLVRDAAARSAMRGASPIAVIQFGTEFALPKGTRFATYDDMTVAQARHSWPYDWTTRLPAADLDYLERRQRSVFARAHVCCTATHWAAASLTEDYGIDPARVRVVGVGATHATSPPPDRDWAVPRFLFVGKDWGRKNGDAMLRAFAEIRADHPNATMDLVGGHPTIEQPGVHGHGRLVAGAPGTRPLLEELQRRATCFVMASRHEPAGIAYVEAASAGVGAIGSTSGGSATLIGDGGLTVDPNDQAALVTAMRRFTDPDTARRFGANAAARAPLFTWPAVVERLLDALLDRPALADRNAL